MIDGGHSLAMSFTINWTRYYENAINNKNAVFSLHSQSISYNVQLVIIYDYIKQNNCILIGDVKCNGGMQDHNDRKYVKEIKTLIQIFGDSITEEELQQKIEKHYGNIEMVIKDLVQQSIEKENKLEAETKTNELKNAEQKQEQGNIVNVINSSNKSVQKDMEKTEIGETRPGINLQGYCSSETCLVSKAKLLVWVNIGFDNINFVSDKTSFSCPDCKKLTITPIIKAMFYNSEYSISASDSP
ncbi:hypothetical protein RFI_02499, partial [Reticulomyxa filosa]